MTQQNWNDNKDFNGQKQLADIYLSNLPDRVYKDLMLVRGFLIEDCAIYNAKQYYADQKRKQILYQALKN